MALRVALCVTVFVGGVASVDMAAAQVSLATDSVADGGQENTAVVIASKPFGESFLLAEMFAQLVESRGIPVDRRPGLGATEIAFQALRTGAIDVYPEYTGTGLVAVLGEAPGGTPTEVFRRVSAEFRGRWGVHWLPPLGFENTYAISVRSQFADSLGLRTLSDLASVSVALTGGFSPDFIGREDGLPGLQARYGLRPAEVRALLQSIKYQALSLGEVDVIDGYSTDGLIARYELTVLEDDRNFFPPYEAAALVSRRLWETRPDAVKALTELSGTLDEAMMRELNRRVEVEGEEVADVARSALAELDLIQAPALRLLRGDAPTELHFGTYMWARRAETLRLTARHMFLVSISLLAAVLVAVPLGLVLERAKVGAETVIRGIGVLQTIPSIALLAFMIPLLGIGVVPALVALFLYSLFPIVRNTFTGIRDADPSAVDSARSLGMTASQILRHVRLPLATPVIMAGVRTAGVITVGTATLAAFIGAGGLGDPIVAGLALSDIQMILAGAVPAALLSLLVDAVLASVEWRVTPRGVGDR